MQLLNSYFEELFDPKDILQNWRKKAWDRFEEIGIPTSQQEAFQYVQFKEFPTFKPAEKKQEKTNSSELLFIDGFFQKTTLPSPLICLSLNEAMHTYGIFLQNRWNRSLKEEIDPLAALNGAFQGEGAFLYVPPNVHVKDPIILRHLLSSSKTSSPRLHIYLNKGSKLTLLQTTESQENAFGNALIDVVLDTGASLNFQETQNFENSTHYFQTFRASLKRDSKLETLSFSRGGKIARSSMKVQLLEENSEVELKGLSHLNGSLQNHTHITVEHVAPHCRSRQHFKTILEERSKASFEGKILVRPIAQKTESYQLNNNLLLSDEASANSKPNLEIFADDVKASHGCTIGQLDKEQLFYLRSRGLSQLDAEKWLIHGFAKELLNEMHPLLQKGL
jgi:Fe-S cluster assembly protein SufD